MLWNEFFNPEIEMHVLPGGRRPERQTEGAIGFDAYLRAIVCPHEMSDEEPLLRKTLFDFSKEAAQSLPAVNTRKGAARAHTNSDKHWEYVLHPGDSVCVGLGFVTRMPFPLLYWVAPRSGLASRHRITVGNAPGTVDPDYRGEAGAIIVNEGRQSFNLRREMRIVQVVFQWAIIPQFREVKTHEELLDTTRSASGFGSTGH